MSKAEQKDRRFIGEMHVTGKSLGVRAPAGPADRRLACPAAEEDPEPEQPAEQTESDSEKLLPPPKGRSEQRR